MPYPSLPLFFSLSLYVCISSLFIYLSVPPYVTYFRLTAYRTLAPFVEPFVPLSPESEAGALLHPPAPGRHRFQESGGLNQSSAQRSGALGARDRVHGEFTLEQRSTEHRMVIMSDK